MNCTLLPSTGTKFVLLVLCVFGAILPPLEVAAQTPTYPTAFQITDRDAPGQVLVKLQDYAVGLDSRPTTDLGDSRTNLQIARINFMRAEPATAPGFASRMFVNDLNGKLYTLSTSTPTKQFSTYIDFRSEFTNFDASPGFAGGVVTFQFDPEYASVGSPNYGKFYTTHTEIQPPSTAFRFGVVTAWQDTNIADGEFTGTHREMLRVQYVGNAHPIGDIAFNPNAQAGDADYRMMYIASGDGVAGESGSTSTRNMPQMLNNYLGKVLRIQPDDPDGAGPLAYGIPADNPFVSAPYAGTAAKGEIWAYGFRNPHRLEFDSTSGKLIVDDIGLNSYEEVNIVRKGANYGYSKLEGNQVLGTNNIVSQSQNPPALPSTLPIWIDTTPAGGFNSLTIVPTYPVTQFSHRDGDAISSGFVYRGTKIPALVGKYVFGDIANGRLFYTDYAEMLAQDAENGGNGNPVTMAAVHELKVMYNGASVRVFDVVRNLFDLRNDGLADGDNLPGGASSTNQGVLDPYGVAYTGGRADIRWTMGGDGELYLISKSDGMIRALLHPGDYTGVFGDFNFDSMFTNLDIQKMLNALADSSSFKNTHQLADADLVAMGDFNHDSQFNGADIRGMLQALANGGALQPVPEPTAVSLAAIGIVGLFVLRMRRYAVGAA